MPKQMIALAFTPPQRPLHEAEYQALVSALSESARGRAFLDEHARRTRADDTAVLLAALERIEALVRAQNAPTATELARADLQRLLDDLRAARPLAETSPLQAKATQLAALLDLLESRLVSVLDPISDPGKTNDATSESTTIRRMDGPARIRRVDSLPDALSAETDALLSRPDQAPEEEFSAAREKAPVNPGEDNRSSSPPSSPGVHNALALIMALSEEEQIALFT